MGTKVDCKSYLPGYYSMRDINGNSNSSSWPVFYGDKTLTNGQYYNGFVPRTVTDAYPGYDKDELKQKMLEHEAIFKNQVYELHRLYRIQRDMMEEVKRMEIRKHHISIEPSSSSSLLPSQMLSEDGWKWHTPILPLGTPNCARPSVLGAQIVNSSLSCTKGNSTPSGRGPSQNGCSSENCEVLEFRPSKVRKKLFDLELPADENIDTEEGGQLENNKRSDISSYTPDGNHKIAGDTSTSDSCLRSSLGLADLNEPFRVEAPNAPPSVDFLGHSACNGERGLDSAAKPKSPFLGFPREFVQNFQHGSHGTADNLTVENKGNRRDWSSYMYEAGNNKSNLNSIPQYLQSDKLPIPSQSTQLMYSKAHQPPGFFSTDHSRRDLWREKTGRGVEISDRSHDHCNYNRPEPVLTSCISRPYPFVNSSDDLANSWSHFASSRGKPGGSSTQKLTSVQTHPFFNSYTSLSRNSQSSDQSHEIFGDKWHVNGSSSSNKGLTSELPPWNGFYHGLSSGPKELLFSFSPIGFDNRNCNKGDNVASERVINHVSEKFFMGSNGMDLKTPKDMNLNLVPKNSSNDIEVMDEKSMCEDHLAVLPWLRAKPVDVEAKKEIGDNLGQRSLLPIFENPSISKNDSSLFVSTSASLHCLPEGEHRLIDINVACNLPETGKQTSEEALVAEKGTDAKVANFRNHIDLNSCVSEDEDPFPRSIASTSANVKIPVEIDLEAPVILETEESVLPVVPQTEESKPPVISETEESILPVVPQTEESKPPEDEFVRTAAEAIVAISSSGQHGDMVGHTCHPPEASLENSLLWFVDVVSSCVGDLDSKFGKESRGDDGCVEGFFSSEIDYFEAMTLRIIETKEEDYMPKPLVPETREVEEMGATSLRNQSRKGQARRGRQRRDFQRDILPGLVSLARHEVTEDLQTFGGLMRATGHPWKSGLTRRNGARNGAARRRQRSVVDLAAPPVVVETPVCTPLMQQLNNFEVGLEERSLTGWGKTTRRPRRQRCPAGNPLSITLT